MINTMLPVLFSFGQFTFYTLGFFLAVGFFLGAFIAWRRLTELGLNEEKVLDVLILGSVVGLVFSRLFYALENYPHGGFSFWGGIAGFLLVFLLFGKNQKWDLWIVADELAFAILPFAVLAQTGAFLDGSTPGRPTTMPWGVYFPGSLVRAQPISLFMAVSFFLTWIFILRIEREWRTWSWYKSKAEGFIFLSFLFFAVLATLLIDFLTTSAVYWLAIKIVSGLIAILIIALIFLYRSGSFHFRQ